MRIRILLLVTLLSCNVISTEAQILKKLKKATEGITSSLSLNKLSRDPVTTSFKDVNKTKYLSNDFGNDVEYENLHRQPYSWENGFFLTPGFYQGHFKSFCIKAGTYSPQGGSGKFYAELKGPKADIVATIIDGYQKSEGITQFDIQLLLWAIVTKADFQKMGGPTKKLALKLLDAKQIARLNKDALDRYVRSEINKVARNNEALRFILEAENELRNKFYQGVGEYSEYEEIAMRAGVEPVLNGFEEGRWTKHPNGFFIRYFIPSYSKTVVQIYVPEDIATIQPIGGNGISDGEANLPFVGTFYKSRNSVAVPASNNGQRIIQTDLPGDASEGKPGDGNGNDGQVDVDITIGGTGGNGGNDGNDGNDGNGGNSGNDGNDGTSGSEGTGGSEGSGGSGGSGDSNGSGGSSGTTPSGDQENNAFPCEVVINPKADATVKLDMRNQNIPGVLVAIFKGDSIIHMQAYGKMRLGHPLTLDTKLQWASLSKSVTGVAAMQMIEDGRLKFSDKPATLLSYWPNSVEVKDEDGKTVTEDRYDDITLRQLLNNTSGIQQYGLGKYDDPFTIYKDRKIFFTHNDDYSSTMSGGFNAASSVGQFNKSVLDFDPGEKYLYTSYGFNLAGAMIDSKVGYGYDDWVISHIKLKLGLRNFGVAHKPNNRFGYQFSSDGILNNNVLSDYEDVLPSGGWESTICDLATYTRALSQGELINDREALWKESNSTVINDTTKLKYGLGLNHLGTGNNLRVFHGGTQNGTRAYLHFFPSDSTGVVLLAPFRQANLERLAGNLINDLELRKDLYKTKSEPLDRCRRGMDDKEDLFTAIWRKSGKSQLVRTGLSKNEFIDEIRIMRDNYGYHLDDFEAHMTNDERIVYDGVFKEGKRTQILITELDVFEFRQETARLKEQGLEITDFEYVPLKPGIQESDKIGFAAIMEKGAAESNYRQFSDLGDLLEFADQQGPNSTIRIVDVETHPKENGVLCTAIYVRGTPTILKSSSITIFLRAMEEGAYSSLGNPIDIDLYSEGDSNFKGYISLWDPTDKTDYRTSFVKTNQQALRFCDIMEMHETNRDDGYELIEMDRLFTTVND